MADADLKDLSDAHTQMPSLKGRKAIITGGTTGIGRAIGVLLASEGVEIFTCGRDAQHLRDGLARINEVGKGDGINVDLAEKEGLNRFFAEAANRLGSYDIAIINAAVSLEGGSSLYAGIKKGIQGFAEALRKEVSSKGIKVGLVEPGLTGSDLQYPGIPAEKQREMINAEKMLRAEDIAVAVHFMLTQPRRAVVQQLAVTQRVSEEA